LQRRLQTLLTQIAHDEVLDRLNVALKHPSVYFFMSKPRRTPS
jgi:hypothetical protein